MNILLGTAVIFFALCAVTFLTLRCRAIINNIAENPNRTTRETLKDLNE